MPLKGKTGSDVEALKLKAILESAAAGIITIDSAGRIETVNRWVEREFGYAAGDLVGQNVTILMPEPYRSKHDEYLRAYLETGKSKIIGVGREVVGQRKDGTTFAMHLSVGEFEIGEDKFFAGIVQDMSAQRDVERRLERKRALFLSIFESLPDPIVIADASGEISLVNPAFTRVFGYSEAEMPGNGMHLIAASESWQQSLGADRDGPRKVAEMNAVRFRRKNGETFPATTIEADFCDQAGDRLGRVVLIHDTTAERQQEAVLLQAQRMEAVGQLTGGVAHDFNNLLTVILGNIELLEAHLTDELSQSLAAEAREAAEMGARLTDRLLTFARRKRLETERINLNEFVLSLTELLRRTIGGSIDLSISLAADLWPTFVDPGQVENAVLNLAINARDAMPSGGRLLIETYNQTLDREAVALLPDLTVGDYVVLSVTDTGHGMPPEVAERAFEPFFTTKGAGKGSGLGLATIYGFARQSGGGVSIYSEVDNGTTVKLYLPRFADAEMVARAENSAAEADGGRGEVVLVVEDDDRVRRLTVSRLKVLGYQVCEASNGAEALEELERSPGINLVFTDLVMPGGMSGLDLAARVLEQYPNIKIVLTSGYSADLVNGKTPEQAGLRVLRKPYSQSELARVFGEVLRGKARSRAR